MDQELYRFRAIIGHQGPLLATDADWKGSKYNVQVEWDTGEITFEPLSIIAADDPVICAAYAKENDLLALEGWCRFRNLAKKDKVLARAIKQSKIRQVRRSQTYMFGYLIPRTYMEAMQFDSENKNSKWYDAIKMEMESMAEYKVFKKWDEAILDKHKKVMNSPKGYYRIKVHLVFAVKFDGRHKARLVADGHLAPEVWKPPSPFSNVHFRNTTKILQHKFFTLKLLFIFTLSLIKVSFPQTMSLSCIFVFAPSFICMDLSIMSTSTSLTFSEFLVLFSSISLLFSFIEIHFALSSARCHL